MADPGRLIVLSHPTHQHVYETVRAAQDSGRAVFFTTFFWHSERRLWRLLGRILPRASRTRVEHFLSRRSHPGLEQADIRLVPWYHAARIAGSPLPLRTRGRRSSLPDRAFDRHIAWRSGRLGPDVFHGFEGFAATTFDRLSRNGTRLVLDVASAHEVYEALDRRVGIPPDLAHTARVLRERELADVLLVPAQWIWDDMVGRGVAPAKLRLVPYGVDVEGFAQRRAEPQGPFTLLYAGLVAERKGVADLLEAWRRLGLVDARLLLVGRVGDANEHLVRDLPPSVEWRSGVAKADMPAIMRSAHALALPSYADSWGLVVTEAMATGLPVITSDRTGAPVTHESDGLVIPAGDVDALAGAIRRLHEDPGLRVRLGATARSTVEREYTWSHYRDRVRRVYEELS